MKPGAPLLEPEWGDNVMLQREFVSGDFERGLAAADGMLRGRLKAHRYVASPLEPRAFLASADPHGEGLTLWASTQMPHSLRSLLAAQLGMADHDIRVVQPHVGGGFGLEGPLSPEEVLVAWCSRRLRRPVKWVEERTEHFLPRATAARPSSSTRPATVQVLVEQVAAVAATALGDEHAARHEARRVERYGLHVAERDDAGAERDRGAGTLVDAGVGDLDISGLEGPDCGCRAG
jgi:CO/xanthine dehydrogenase Mo-binding subunit